MRYHATYPPTFFDISVLYTYKCSAPGVRGGRGRSASRSHPLVRDGAVPASAPRVPRLGTDRQRLRLRLQVEPILQGWAHARARIESMRQECNLNKIDKGSTTLDLE